MRAATALASLLQTSAPIWRGDAIAADAVSPCVPSSFAALDAELPGGGWPAGQLVELLARDSGIGELSLLAPALACIARDRPCVWVLPCDQATHTAALPYPPALADAGIAIERSIFVRPATPRESLWAMEQSLRTAHLGMLIGWLPASSSHDGDFRALRRLHLLAQKHRALVFLLRPAAAAQAASPAALRLQLAAAHGRLHVTVLKRRGWPLLEPIMLQVHPEHWSEARAPCAQVVPLPLSSAAPVPPESLPSLRIALTETLARRAA
jgi:hypothetical protein